MHKVSSEKQERIKYFRGLKLLVKANGNHSKYIDAEQEGGGKRRKNWGRMIWLEIRAWQSGLYDEDYDALLIRKRKENVPKALDRLSNFHFSRNDQCKKDVCGKSTKDQKNENCIFNQSLKDMNLEYLLQLRQGFKQVRDVLDELQQVENLYSNNSYLASDYSSYSCEPFQTKLSTMCIWYNTCSQLLTTFKSFLNLLGILGLDDLLSTGRSEQVTEVAEEFQMNRICCEISKAIFKRAERYLRKYNVQYVLSLFINKYFRPLISLHSVFVPHQHSSKAMLPDDVLHFIPDEVITCSLDADWYGLPKLDIIYKSICRITLEMLRQCLRLRLQQAITCQPNCQTPSCLMTVQQVVVECKEVITCSWSMTKMFTFLLFGLPANEQLSEQLHLFENDLLKMFSIYLDFTQLLLVRQLTRLPCLPQGFIGCLRQEWTFAKKIAVSMNSEAPMLCTCKFITICKEAIVSTEHFMQTALNAVLTSSIHVDNEKPDNCCTNDDLSPRTIYLTQTRWTSNRSMSAPISTEAGMLWFHRQRMEKPFFARSHSILEELPETSHTRALSEGSYTPTVDFHHIAPSPTCEDNRRYLFELSRAIRDLFDEVRERTLRILNFVREFRKDMESAVEFSFKSVKAGKLAHGNKIKKSNREDASSLMEKMRRMGYVKIEFPSNDNELDVYASSSFFVLEDRNLVREKTKNWIEMFCENILKENTHISDDENHHIIYVKQQAEPLLELTSWEGEILKFSRCDKLLSLMKNSLLIRHQFTVVFGTGWDLGQKRNKLMKNFANFLTMEVAQSSILKEVSISMQELRTSIFSLCVAVCGLVKEVAVHLQDQTKSKLDPDEEEQIKTEVGRVAQKNFNFTFECIKEATRLFSGSYRYEMDELHLEVAQHWMDYVMKFVQRGKGIKPRWANLGLNFITGISMDVVGDIPADKYQKLREKIKTFIDHLIGMRPLKSAAGVPSDGARAPHPASEYRSLSSGKEKEDFLDSSAFQTAQLEDDVINDDVTPMEHIRNSLRRRDEADDVRKRESGIIGHVIETQEATSWRALSQLGHRSVNFKWQRGTKLGQGSFGQVYTCVNIDTGKILAMKEVEFQASNEQKIKEAVAEIVALEGISHRNLIRYYGMEIHRDQIHIFMEYCDAGTLEEVGHLGLPMAHIQDYTAQLLAAVYVLHDHGIIHRDIKGSNIFLTSNGVLKLGDFGSAIRLINRSFTMPGEISSHSGITAAYTAPEVINNIDKRGYGRSADVWSIGCVVIEMASGKRPWYDHEPFQIMYKVGMGCKPQIPGCLFDEGRSFVDHCLETDPDQRWRVEQLQLHSFVRVAHN